MFTIKSLQSGSKCPKLVPNFCVLKILFSHSPSIFEFSVKEANAYFKKLNNRIKLDTIDLAKL